MTSIILRTATRPLSALILLYSVYLLVRGHDEPGGGFIGGLVAGGAFALYLLANGLAAAREAMRLPPGVLVGGGLLLAALSGVPGLLRGQGYLTGQWPKVRLPVVGSLPIGTPFAFDLGVYLLVAGMTITIVLALAEEE